MASAMDAADRSHAETTESLISAQRSGEALEFKWVKGPSSSTRNINSRPVRIAGELPCSLLFADVDGSRALPVLPPGGSESERALLADVWAPKRTPENLPRQKQQYLARSLFAE